MTAIVSHNTAYIRPDATEKFAVYLGGDNFFCFGEGHYGSKDLWTSPPGWGRVTCNFAEAVRRLGYAKKDSKMGGARIVIIKGIDIVDVPVDEITKLQREHALAKLDSEDKRVLGLA